MKNLWGSGAVTVGFLGVCVAACSPLESSPEVVEAREAMQGPNKPGPIDPRVQPPPVPGECMGSPDKPCMRYLLPLLGNPSENVDLQNKYIAAFGSACYMSEAGAFNCFYRTGLEACKNAVNISEVFGGVPSDKGYPCLPVGNGDYTVQVGADAAVKLYISYINAPRETPLIPVNGTPTEVNGPYRNLPEPQKVSPGHRFNCRNTDADGKVINQKDLIIQMNRAAHSGEIHSDLAGFKWPCDDNGTICEEPTVLADPKKKPILFPGALPEVHHVVPARDLRGCRWGTNSNKNAAVISHDLNRFLTNNYPPEKEVQQINSAMPYSP